MKYFPFFLIISFFFSSLPTIVSATTTDPYADTVESVSFANAINPNNAIGAPDEQYTDFMGKDASVILDMGEGEEGTGNLILHMFLLSYGATAFVTFLDANQNIIFTQGHTFSIGESLANISYTESVPYRYVRITSSEEEEWKLDAIEALEYNQPQITEETTLTIEDETSIEQETPTEEQTDATQGLLITLPDDGDPQTTVDNAVYFVGSEGTRHAFPSETVFHSWYQNFEDLAYVNSELLAEYTLGKNVTVRPGTYLIKLQTDPKVYAVEPGGILRWITSEEIAKTLYGKKWAERVIDVPDVFFGNYQVGEPVETAVYPDGTLGVDSSTGEVLYIQNGSYYHLRSETGNTMRFNSDFYVEITSDLLKLYVDAGDLSEENSIRWPY